MDGLTYPQFSILIMLVRNRIRTERKRIGKAKMDEAIHLLKIAELEVLLDKLEEARTAL